MQLGPDRSLAQCLRWLAGPADGLCTKCGGPLTRLSADFVVVVGRLSVRRYCSLKCVCEEYEAAVAEVFAELAAEEDAER